MQSAIKRGVICKCLLQDGKCAQDKRQYCRFDPKQATEWFDEEFSTIEPGEICGKQSIFGNQYIGISAEQLESLKAGKVLYIGGE